jgi:hypothetical protein
MMFRRPLRLCGKIQPQGTCQVIQSTKFRMSGPGLRTVAVNRRLYGRLGRVNTRTVRASTAHTDGPVDQRVHTVEPDR